MCTRLYASASGSLDNPVTVTSLQPSLPASSRPPTWLTNHPPLPPPFAVVVAAALVSRIISKYNHRLLRIGRVRVCTRVYMHARLYAGNTHSFMYRDVRVAACRPFSLPMCSLFSFSGFAMRIDRRDKLTAMEAYKRRKETLFFCLLTKSTWVFLTYDMHELGSCT